MATTLLLLAGCSGDTAPSGSGRSPGPGRSALWGDSGDLWSPEGRLPDFSHAGYGGGSEPIPDVPVAATVTDFGAVGDGIADDSEAFLAALAAMTAVRPGETGAVFIPPGRYRLSRVLELHQSGLVLRGAGRDETVLFFDRPLFDILGEGTYGGPFGWAWGGGLIWSQGDIPDGKPLAEVVRPARRGERTLRLSTTEGIVPGSLVRLTQIEADGSLSLHLHAGQPLGGHCWVDEPGFRIIDWIVRVESVARKKIVLDRPLRADVEPRWTPRILPFQPTVRDVGVEHLTIEFPPTEYNGHHLEPGYNGVYFEQVHNGWVRDVRVVHFDTAVSFYHSRYSTASDLHLTGRGGHYGLNLAASQDCLMTRFRIDNTSRHDLSVSNLANGNVFSNGRGVDVNFDHHRSAAYENLFSNIHVGEAWRKGRLWDSSGTPSGHYTAARETFWNIRPRVSTKWLPAWPQMNVIGAVREKESVTEQLDDLWLEARRQLVPADLHEAQVRRKKEAEADVSDNL